MANHLLAAHLPPPPSSLKTLDGTRQRLQQLSISISNLRQALESNAQLPHWESLTSQSDLITHQLHTLTTFLTDSSNSSFFNAAHAYPLPSFTDNNHEPVIQALLRAKPEPDVEKRRDEGVRRACVVVDDKSAASGEATAEAGDGGNGLGLDMKGYKALWDSAAEMAVSVSSETPFGIDYTMAERELLVEEKEVTTGLKRELDDGLDEVEEDGGDEEDNDVAVGLEDRAAKVEAKVAQKPAKHAVTPKLQKGESRPVRPPALLEDMMRFVSSGVMSPALAAASGGT